MSDGRQRGRDWEEGKKIKGELIQVMEGKGEEIRKKVKK